jgi:hypothetical protein
MPCKDTEQLAFRSTHKAVTDDSHGYGHRHRHGEDEAVHQPLEAPTLGFRVRKRYFTGSKLCKSVAENKTLVHDI